MWLSFFCLSICLVTLLLCPGFLFAYGISRDRLFSLLSAPLCAVFLLATVSILNSALGLFTSPGFIMVELLSIAIAVAIIGAIARSRFGFAFTVPDLPASKVVVFALAFSFAIAIYNYAIPLDGPSSFAQDSDNSFHLSLIRSFVESGNWSSLGVSVYSGMGENQIAPFGGGFYPAVWHALAAFVCGIAGGDPCIAANVVNFTTLFIVFPFSSLLLFSVLFPDKKWAQVAGVVLSFAFSSFPWGTLLSVSGPLFPNTLGFSLVPACAALFIAFVNRVSEEQFRLKSALPYIVLLICGFVAMSLAHPNAVFTMAVFVVPFTLYRIFVYTDRFKSNLKRALVLGGAIAVFLAVWVLLYGSPFLYGVTHFRWASTASSSQAIINCLSLSFRLPACSFVLPVIVLAGVLYSIKEWRRYAWLSCSFVFACAIYIVGASSDGTLKGLVAGFWYTDPYRLGASACLMAMPLAAIGAYAIGSLLKMGFEALRFERVPTLLCVGAFAAAAVFFSFVGNYSIPGLAGVTTGFGDYRWCATFSNSYDRPNLFDEDEKAFCSKAKDIIGEDLVYNNADDGSVFAYPLYDINLVYKRSLGDRRKSINPDEQVLCEKLNEINENPEVKEILYRSGVKYILNLDYGGEPLYDRCYYGSYDPDNWRGMNALKDDNPSLKVVLSEGDCRLYKILY